MDKKKVKELMEQILKYCDQAYNPNWQPKSFEEFIKLGNICREAIKELNKSDWVSVEDGLPEYGKIVNVCSKYDVDDIWSTFRTQNYFIDTDTFEFANDYYGHMDITHWKPIEKLEE